MFRKLGPMCGLSWKLGTNRVIYAKRELYKKGIQGLSSVMVGYSPARACSRKCVLPVRVYRTSAGGASLVELLELVLEDELEELRLECCELSDDDGP